MKQEGSVVILVLLMLTTLVILCSKQWLTVTYTLDAIVQKERAEKLFWLAQGLLECSCVMSKNHWQELCEALDEEGGKGVTLLLPNVPSDYEARLEIEKRNQSSLKLEIALYQQSKKVAAQSCLMSTHTQQNLIMLEEWKSA